MRSHQPPASEKHCWAPRNVANNTTKICFIEVVLREKLTYSCMFHLVCRSHRCTDDDGDLVASDGTLTVSPQKRHRNPPKVGKMYLKTVGKSFTPSKSLHELTVNRSDPIKEP